MENENKQPLEENELEGVDGGNILDSLIEAAGSAMESTYKCDGCGATYKLNAVANAGFNVVLGGNYCPNCLRAKGMV